MKLKSLPCTNVMVSFLIDLNTYMKYINRFIVYQFVLHAEINSRTCENFARFHQCENFHVLWLIENEHIFQVCFGVYCVFRIQHEWLGIWNKREDFGEVIQSIAKITFDKFITMLSHQLCLPNIRIRIEAQSKFICSKKNC